MKVLFIVNCSNFFNSHFLNLALSVKNSGHDVCISSGNDLHKEKFENLGFKFYKIQLSRSGQNLLFELFSMFSIYKLLRYYNPDLVHMFTIKPIIYTGFICRFFTHLAPVTIVSSVTGLGSSALSRKLSGKILWAFLKLAYKYALSLPQVKVVFENSDDCNLFVYNKIVPIHKCFLINGAGVDINKFSPSCNKLDIITVIFVARLLKDKGTREFIEAGKLLKEMNVNVQLYLVGSIDNNNPSSMKEYEIINAVEKGYIQALGHREDIANCYQKAHIACLPSYREGLPKSLIEASACGLPIITTDVPGCRQIIHEGCNGILVPVKNSIALANAIKQLALDYDMMCNMGKESRRIAEEKYSYSTIIDSFLRIYNITDLRKSNEK